MERKPHYGQANPKDQAIVILGSVQGFITNLTDGVYGALTYKQKEKLEIVSKQLTDAHHLVVDLPPGEFTHMKRETTVSFKASIEFDGYRPADDPSIKQLIEKVAALGLKFEMGHVYVSHTTNGVTAVTQVDVK